MDEDRAMPNLPLCERVAALRTFFLAGATRSLDWRRGQLVALRRMFVEREADFREALHEDLRKPRGEAYLSEIGFCISEIDHAIRHLGSWAKRQRVAAPVFVQPGSAWVEWEPLGVCLILGAWNYPIQLTLGPLVPCIAAGNTALIKPPPAAAAVFRALREHLPRYISSEAFYVTDVEEERDHETLLSQRYDKIFYTGGDRVGRIVMAAAARHLTPVTLELGGKSPCLVDKSARLPVAARRIAYGRFMNAGQTCIAPDYVLAHQSILEPLLEELTAAIRSFYGPDPQISPDYARIINEHHFERLRGLLENQRIVTGGRVDPADRYIAPTVLCEVRPDSPVMQEEIFGPILPVLAVGGVEEAIRFVNTREKPLALYVFAEDRTVAARVFAQTSSGAAVLNQTVLHCAVPGLPFGGVGSSGMGKYHGRWGFEAFSNPKAVLEQSAAIDLSLPYPPSTPKKTAILRALLSAQGMLGAVTKAVAASIRRHDGSERE